MYFSARSTGSPTAAPSSLAVPYEAAPSQRALLMEQALLFHEGSHKANRISEAEVYDLCICIIILLKKFLFVFSETKTSVHHPNAHFYTDQFSNLTDPTDSINNQHVQSLSMEKNINVSTSPQDFLHSMPGGGIQDIYARAPMNYAMKPERGSMPPTPPGKDRLYPQSNFTF
jgi:hypothetical protein